MGIALLLIGIAIIIFLAKSQIPNSDLERLANVTSIVIFVFGVISLFFPLPSLKETVSLGKEPTPTVSYNSTSSPLSTYIITMTNATSGCELKEFVAYFESDETLFVDYKFPSGFFGVVPSHVGFVINGADFDDGFKVDELLSYSISHKIIKSGEYRVGFIWHGRYERDVTAILPTKNWEIVLSDCSQK